MKYLFIILSLICVYSCSFDTKSGIWKNEDIFTKAKDKNVFKDFKKINYKSNEFNEIIPINENFKFRINKPFLNNSWEDIFYGENNNIENLKYDNENSNFFKTKRLSNAIVNERILVLDDKLIINDQKGNIIIYSIKEKSIIANFNFYKKRYKNINKKLYLIVENKIIYVTDNLGFIYAYSYDKKKLIWAKKYKVPFRSNIKLFSDKLVTSNQNNDLILINKYSGDILNQLPTEETLINNLFINNIALSDNKIFFLNSFGSLYSINKNNFKIEWFINLNNSLGSNLSSLFYGSNLVYSKNKIFVSSGENFYIVNSSNGSVSNRENFYSSFRPIINNNYVFLITNNNFLISLNLADGNVIYSYDIAKKISEFTKTKKKEIRIKNYILANNEIFVFLKNSFVVKFNVYGEIKKIFKLPSNIKSFPLIVDNKILFVGKKNKLISLN